ncbi:MAG: hypothetical protein AAF004_03320 [Pseudomonadota bacterium]
MTTARIAKASLILAFIASNVGAQSADIHIEQLAPLPVAPLAYEDENSTVAFALSVSAACPTMGKTTELLLGSADATKMLELDDGDAQTVNFEINARQLAGLQVATLCQRINDTPEANPQWVLKGAFNLQATLICEDAQRAHHYPAAIALDVAVDCTAPDENTTALGDAAPES